MKLCGLTMLSLALGISSAAAQDKTFELKLSHWVPPSHPLQKAIEDWGASVEKDSGGTIKYKHFSLVRPHQTCAFTTYSPGATYHLVKPGEAASRAS
jgi:hypothetical protein